MLKKVFIKTFGCQMNVYDSNRILDTVKKIGFTETKNLNESDCFILNTCHIREKATDKVYHEVGRVKKEFRHRKKPIVLIVGCVAQAEGDILLQKEKYIDSVVGPQSYHEINKIILDIENSNARINSTEFEVIEKFDQLNLVKNSNSKISSFLTIQEGCDKFCKFCVVPYTRGPEYSRSYLEIISEAKQLVDNGSQEIILLGQNVNAYNFKNKRLSDLLYSLSEIKNLERIRYTTSHPKDFTDDLIEIHGECKKLMPLLHLPVQSGSTKILKSMSRNHTIEEYLEIIEKLQKKNSSIKFSSDFIIAYPGETKDDFEKTVSLMKQVEFINSYSFIFSPRPGTVAENLDLIEKKISIERLEKIQNILFENQIQMNKSLEDKVIDVLVENLTDDKSKAFGRSEYMTSVIFNGKKCDIGKIVQVRVNDSNRNTLFGEIITNSDQKVA